MAFINPHLIIVAILVVTLACALNDEGLASESSCIVLVEDGASIAVLIGDFNTRGHKWVKGTDVSLVVRLTFGFRIEEITFGCRGCCTAIGSSPLHVSIVFRRDVAGLVARRLVLTEALTLTKSMRLGVI